MRLRCSMAWIGSSLAALDAGGSGLEGGGEVGFCS